MDTNLILTASAIGVGLLLLFIFVPFKYIWSFLYKGVLGAIILLAINFVCTPLGFFVGVNPITSLWCGFLGVPGLISLIALKFMVN